MPVYRERARTLNACQYTGDNEAVLRAWASAHGITTARFLDDGVKYHVRRDNIWMPVPAGYHLCKRPGEEEPFVLNPQSFDNLYEEIPA